MNYHKIFHIDGRENVRFCLRQLLRRRMKGVMCNTAKMTPEELDGSPVLITEEPKPYAEKEFLLHTKWGFKVLGGCCGTDERHIGELLRLLVEYHKHN